MPIKILEKREPLWIFIIGIILFSTNIWGMELYILDEVRNAVSAREMLERGDLIVPTFNYDLRVDKPPLHYYFLILASYFFGFGEFSARIFSSLAGALTVLSTYLFAVRYLGKKAAVWAAAALLTSLHFALEFHLAVPDPYLILFMVSSIFLLFHGYESNRSIFIYLGYASVGLATMSKGPVAIALTGAIFLFFLLVNREFGWSSLSRFRILQGVLIIGVVVLPWYATVWSQTDGEWVRRFLFEQNISRFLETKEGHGGSILLPTVFIIIGLLPFSLYLPQALLKAWKERNHRAIQLCLITVAVTVVFFSLSQTKLPNYPMPSFPFLAIILGWFVAQIDPIKNKIWINYLVYTLILMAIPLGMYLAFHYFTYLTSSKNIAWGFLILPLGGLTGLIWVLENRIRWAHYGLMGSFIFANFYLFYAGYPAVFDRNPVTTSIKMMDQGVPVVYYKRVNQAFIFHLQRKVPIAHSPKELRTWLADKPRAYILSRKKFWKEFREKRRMKIVYKGADTFEQSVTLLVEYQRR